MDGWIKKDEPVALAHLDVDYFMEINQQLGNEAGDRVLQTVAALLQEWSDKQAYRVSGDEFAVVLPKATLEQAFLKMETLRAQIEQAQDRFELPEDKPVTITIGVAQYPRDAKNEQGLSRAASAALVTAKETGRNQVALAPNEEMVMKSCYYPSTAVRRLKALAEQLNKKESVLLREALNDLLRKYDQQ
ncbi:GGDEF domain-containing protein [Paenibacillus aurantius]|uniref:GGDEF domain-containing protein n=1 Tax=Paenibacillus aurantius TaxID=2918900 RepID=A0AA96RET5_9BACL|nr:GGDEF domain-containing protein [Paenibacillus aurantius]WNQ10736.1 GGDEF domain-containing protein [Paenibacillus aurantius]